MDCFCDYETPEFYRKSIHTARKQYQCYECYRAINPGEQYEVVAAKWDGDFNTCRTCSRCLALRDWVAAHVPCVCWAHGNMIEDCMNTIEAYMHEAPGLWFGAARLKVAIGRNPKRIAA